MFALGAHTLYFVKRTVTGQKLNSFRGKLFVLLYSQQYIFFPSLSLAFVHPIQLARFEIAVWVSFFSLLLD